MELNIGKDFNTLKELIKLLDSDQILQKKCICYDKSGEYN